jgi:hypothetical protein
VGQIDMAIAVYGYSFTPETHRWTLEVREVLSQCVTGRITILYIHLSSISRAIDEKLRPADHEGISRLIKELIAVGKIANERVDGV